MVSFSAGVASLVPSPGQRALELVAAADTALYRAKCEGRDRVVVSGCESKSRKSGAKYSIETLELLAGSLPRRAQAFVLEWAMMHRPALRENWRRCEQHVVPLVPIAGLDEEE